MRYRTGSQKWTEANRREFIFKCFKSILKAFALLCVVWVAVIVHVCQLNRLLQLQSTVKKRIW